MATAAAGRLSVCCMSGGHNPARLASILALFGSVADEIVVAVEESRALATHDAVGHVADRVVSFPPTEFPDQPIPWLFGLCSGKWILNIDDDEVPSPALIEMLPEIVARRDITHAWIARRWLYPTTDTYLAEPPWSTESQLRLFLADEKFMQFSDVFHRPIVAYPIASTRRWRQRDRRRTAPAGSRLRSSRIALGHVTHLCARHGAGG